MLILQRDERQAGNGGLDPGSNLGVYRRLSRSTPLGGSYADAPTRILIVGGGFGGLAAARGLAHAFGGTEDVGVALVDRMNYTTFWPMVPSIIPSNAEVRHVAHSLRRILKPLGVEFFQDEVDRCGLRGPPRKGGKQRISVRLPCACPWQSHDLLRHPRRRRECHGHQGFARRPAGTQPCDRLLRGSPSASGMGPPTNCSPSSSSEGDLPGSRPRPRCTTLIFDVLQDDYTNVDFDRVRIVLVNAGDHILKGLDSSLVNAATLRLASQRIEVINGAKVEEVKPDAVVISEGRTIPTRTTIWAAGIEPPPLVGNLDAQKDHRGENPRRPVSAGEGQACGIRRGRLHQHAVRRTTGPRARPGRRTAGQSGGGEHRGGDRERGARSPSVTAPWANWWISAKVAPW